MSPATPATPGPTRIQFDLFPAFVAVLPPHHDLAAADLRSAPVSPGAYQVQAARVIVAENPHHILVVKDTPQGPLPVFSAAYVPESFHKAPTRSADSYLTTVSGQKLAFKKDSGCACGSRLRGWNPRPLLATLKDSAA